jgi:hypothetical protein
LPGGVEFVGDEAVAELGVVAVDIDRGVGQIGVVQVAAADRGGEPGVVGLAGEPQHRHVTATGTRTAAWAPAS